MTIVLSQSAAIQMLPTYLTRLQSLLDDPNNQFWKTPALINYINEARGQVASEGQCIKVIPPATNSIASITVLTVGSGYTSDPAVTITGPGTGATAHSVRTGNTVTSIVVDTPGTTLYDNTTTVTISGGGGSGATASANINCLNTVANQEIYAFSSANVLAQLTSGVKSILFIESVAVSWGSLKPTLEQWNWNDLQAYMRAYPVQSGQPAMWAQLGQGVGGSMYIQPVPTSALPMEWNCVCVPVDLLTSTDPEAIPYPWTDAVPYFAAYLAFLNARRPQEAGEQFATYTNRMLRARAFSESSMVPSYYSG